MLEVSIVTVTVTGREGKWTANRILNENVCESVVLLCSVSCSPRVVGTRTRHCPMHAQRGLSVAEDQFCPVFFRSNPVPLLKVLFTICLSGLIGENQFVFINFAQGVGCVALPSIASDDLLGLLTACATTGMLNTFLS